MSKKDVKLLTLSICSICAFLALNLLHFPFSVPWLLQQSGGVPLLDMMPGRGVGKTYEIIDALGAEGRARHLYFTWTIDLVLPLLFGSALYVAIKSGAERAFGQSQTAGRWAWLAVASAIVDYLENVANTVLLAFYPERFSLLASTSGLLTLMKFSLFGASIVVAISMFAIAFVRRGPG